jgi:flagellar protein FliS
MTLVQRDASKTYGDTAVLTATPGQLILMLYGGAIRFLTRAEGYYRNDNRVAGTAAAHRAVAIVDELNVSLDMEQGEIPQRLRQLYLFTKREILAAAVAADADRIRGLLPLFRELHETWSELVRQDTVLDPEPIAS